MVQYSVLDAVLDSIGLASTVHLVVWLGTDLQPLIERAKDSCRSCRPPKERSALLWSAFLVPIAWMAAAALYFRCLITHWDFMGAWLEDQQVNRSVDVLLHLYLFFLLVCGIYALAITILKIRMFIDLFMIARFGARKYQAIEDSEAQHFSSSSTDLNDAEAEAPSPVGNLLSSRSIQQNHDSRGTGQELNADVIPLEGCINETERPVEGAIWTEIDSPVAEIITRTVQHPILKNIIEAAGPSNQYHSRFDSDDDAVFMTPSSSSSSNSSIGSDELEYAGLGYDPYAFRGIRPRAPFGDRRQRNTTASCGIEQRGFVEKDDDDDDPYGLYYVTPRLSPQDQNVRLDIDHLDIGEPPPPSPSCDSCTSAHAESIPTARRSPVRVPITPTSPTADAEDAKTEKTDVC